MADIVLVHSRLLGPSSWEPLVRRLEATGHRCNVPEPDQPGGEPTPWHELPATLAAKVQHIDRPVIVGHSGAGLLTAPLAQMTNAAGIVLLDAQIPPDQGPVAPAEPEFVTMLGNKADADGLLPPWSRWWGDDILPTLINDPILRERFVSDEPRLPVAWYNDSIEVPAGWDNRRIAYLRFSDAYDGELQQARSRGWTVAALNGGHLHHLNAPDEVARHIEGLLT
jgi:pimeloyl-ACP methyl ester carboxylesterase